MIENKWMPHAVNIANLVAKKNKKYGDSYAKSEAYLQLLFPSGIEPEQYGRMLFLVRDFDKNMRYATEPDLQEENPVADKLGYCLLQLEIDVQNIPAERNCDNCKHKVVGSEDYPCNACDGFDCWESEQGGAVIDSEGTLEAACPGKEGTD